MLRSFGALCLSLLGLAALTQAGSSSGNSVLVVLQPSLKRDAFSLFFDGLEKKGYSLTFRAPKDDTPVIIEHDVPLFDHIILFAPDTKSFAKDISPQALVNVLNHKTNLLIALSPKQTPLSLLAAEFSLILPPPGMPLLSHFPPRDTAPTVIPITVPADNAVLTPGTPPVWFSGVPQALGANPLLVPLLRAPPESFAADTDKDAGAEAVVDAAEKGGEGLWAGSALGVVTGFQTRDSARVVWAGGVELFGDEFAKKEIEKGVKSGNTQFALDTAAWAFQENLVLRIDKTGHHLANETTPREHYTINDLIVYDIAISKYNAAEDAWAPYSGLTDLQLDFTMLDPHVRTALVPVAGAPGIYSATFRAPDRHGVFKFVVDYKRRGWTFLHSSTTVPVIPPRHDGYPRFLSAAWPYYAGAISTSVGFLLFSALWLAGDDRETKKTKKTE
ncbi:dolichyl-diphosphooligosaccharide-protein glycosyltransferase [Auriscalpium vulgare]|uniref:Dolichyl-diphosphooligosaccharide-protein glycosyltransferase n=1 Tax=Auriscalpium vulgare TaxID=40419 RepID=A0ACB8RTL6_9AGAM|nr:dolichyl-diphosphooligosaccharide-protein glycosyltransferase [Auriscalpium vulgare]